MHRFSHSTTPTVIEGTVCRVDVLNREMTLAVDGTSVIFDVPRECPIDLRGDRVRFQVVLPSDRARVTYNHAADRRVARSVEVRTDRPTPAPNSRA